MSFYNPSDWIANLADPQFGMQISAIIIIFFAFLVRKFLSKKPSCLKGAAFFAEMLTAVGIIGLVTLAGRARLDYLVFDSWVAEAQARSDFNKLNKEFIITACNGGNFKSPSVINLKHMNACDFAKRIDANTERNFDLQDLKINIESISGDHLEYNFSTNYIAKIDTLISTTKKKIASIWTNSR